MSYSITVYPYTSLSARHTYWVIGLLGGLSLLTALWFAGQGAWPVMGFMGLEVALALGLLMHHRRQRRQNADVITMDDTDMRVEYIRNRCIVQSWQMPRAWVALSWEEGDGTTCPTLYARAKGQQIALGSFLNTTDKRALYQKLQGCLALTD